MPSDSSRQSTFDSLCSQIVNLVDAAAQKIIVHDDKPNLDHLRCADFAKSASQASEVRSFLDDARTHLEEYNQGISQLEGALSRLKATRNAFEHSIDIADTLIAPVHRLPEDILAEIFEVYVAISLRPSLEGTSWRNYHAVSLELNHGGHSCPILQLSHVCTFWRAVAFSRPTLWASLSLRLGLLKGQKPKSNFLSLLSHFLSHSSHAPLALQISGPYESPSQKKAIDMLIDHCARWEYLAVKDFPQPSTDQPLIFPHLKALSLDHRNPPDDLLPIFAHAPNLENLEGRRNLVLSWDDFREYSFKKLKGIHNISLRGASVGQFLAQTPVLEECTLRNLSGLIADIQDSYHISNLTALSISVDDCPPGIWRTLRTPNLTSLKFLDDGDAAGSNTVEEFSTMLLQSGCMLRRFTLEGIRIDHGIILLRSHPSVESLVLHPRYAFLSSVPHDVRNWFAKLTILDDDSQVPLAPNLRHFEIHHATSQYADHISDIIISRAKHTLPLQEVVIEFVDTYTFGIAHILSVKEACRDLSSRVAPFVDSGLRLNLVEPTLPDGYDDLRPSGSCYGSEDDGSESSDNEEASEGSYGDDSEAS